MEKYHSKLDLIQTEKAIKLVKDTFEKKLAQKLHLIRVSGPLFVYNNTGLNDDLSGKEDPVTFHLVNDSEEVSIVQSLAKWKRYALNKYQFSVDHGLYTDMNAVRKNEVLDALHSAYVDQWDWEKIITRNQRNKTYLKSTVNKIYQALLSCEKILLKNYPMLESFLPEKIFFITTKELEKLYPNKTSKEREYLITKEHKAVFLMEIGNRLPISKQVHDFRAPDYDDWKLNGDLLIYYPLIDNVIELSSMGIRVDEKSLKKQLVLANQEYKEKLFYHQLLLNNKLPLTIGGGIGQSRICMLLLNKIHIGEVQASVWPKKQLEELEKKGVNIL